MKIINKHCLQAVIPMVLASLSGCQGDRDLLPDGYGLDTPVSFSVALDGSSPSAGAEGEGLKSSELMSSDGSVRIPLSYEVSDDICVRTKGEMLNSGKNKEPLSRYAAKIGSTFRMVAFNSDGTRFIPDVSEAGGYAYVDYDQGDWRVREDRIYSWKNNDRKTFYAYANLPDAGAAVSCSDISGETLSYTVPSDARAQKDVLLGFYQGRPYYDESKEKGGIARITFSHAMTAVKFVKGEFTGVTDVKFKSISISNTFKGGDASVTPESFGQTTPESKLVWTPGAEKQVVTLGPKSGETYLEVDSSTGVIGGMDGTFLLIPQNLADENVEITVVVDLDGNENTLDVTCDHNQWRAGRTNTYTFGYDRSDYSLTVEGDVETESTGGIGTYTVTAAAPWKLQYKLGDNDWTDAVAGEIIAHNGKNLVSFDVVSGPASDIPVTVTATVTGASSSESFVTSRTHNQLLTGAPSVGTEDAPWDLSKHDIHGNPNEGGKVRTANCYVVSAPGWYSFPLVYGNAIDEFKVPGGANEEAYNPTGSGDNFLKPFVKADGSGITSPYIEGAVTAYPLWEDVSNYGLINNSSDSEHPEYAADCKIVGTGTDAMVVFHVNQATLTEGNAVIAVADGSGTILWSWQIWVTDADLTPIKVKNNASSPTFDKGMLPLNLGWVDANANASCSVSQYPAKGINVRFVQMRGDEIKNEVVKTIVRKGGVATKSRNYVTNGSSPCYQWGRKDPFIRFNNDGNALSEITTYSPNDFSKVIDTSTPGPVSIEDAIQNPIGFFTSSGNNWCTTSYNNLWSAQNTTVGTEALGYDEAPVKTVYDPCPPGYQVPQGDVFKAFGSGTYDSTNYGRAFQTGYGSTIFFRISGNRGSTGAPQNLTWSEIFLAVPYGVDMGYTFEYNNGSSAQYRGYRFVGGNTIRPVQE